MNSKKRFDVLVDLGGDMGDGTITVYAQNFAIGRSGELAFFDENYQQVRSGFHVFGPGEWKQMAEIAPDAAPPLDSDLDKTI